MKLCIVVRLWSKQLRGVVLVLEVILSLEARVGGGDHTLSSLLQRPVVEGDPPVTLVVLLFCPLGGAAIQRTESVDLLRGDGDLVEEDHVYDILRAGRFAPGALV